MGDAIVELFSGFELATVGAVASVVGVGVAFLIFYFQWRQARGIRNIAITVEKHVLGTITNFGVLLQRVEDIIDLADQEDDACLYMMMYWTWFGVDQIFDGKNYNELNANSSTIVKKIRSRISKNKNTVLVIWPVQDHLDEFSSFCRELFKYRLKMQLGRSNLPKDFDEKITAVAADYLRDVALLENLAKSASNVKLVYRADISALVFAVSGKRATGLYYIGEKEQIAMNAKLGGFESSNPPMVDVLINQVSSFSELRCEGGS